MFFGMAAGSAKLVQYNTSSNTIECKDTWLVQLLVSVILADSLVFIATFSYAYVSIESLSEARKIT